MSGVRGLRAVRATGEPWWVFVLAAVVAVGAAAVAVLADAPLWVQLLAAVLGAAVPLVVARTVERRKVTAERAAVLGKHLGPS